MLVTNSYFTILLHLCSWYNTRACNSCCFYLSLWIFYLSFLEDSICLVNGNRIFINLSGRFFLLFLSSFLVFRLLGRFANHFHHILLELLLLQVQSVLVPNEIRCFWVPPILLHASFKETNHILVVRVLCELKLSAIVHELLEFFGISLAQLIHSNFNLLFLDVVVLLILASSWQSLPR